MYVTDGTRTVSQQRRAAEAKPGKAAEVGKSRHQLGLAVDVEGDVDGFARYARAEGLVPLASEPWHWQEARALTAAERSELAASAEGA